MFIDSSDKTNRDNTYKKHKNESYPEWRKNPQPRPINNVGEFEYDEYYCKESAEPDASG